MRGALLESYVRLADWNEDDSHVAIWEKIYEGYIDHFQERVKYYANKWVDSAAGVRHREILSNIRYLFNQLIFGRRQKVDYFQI
jgi:hypothetical protein